MEVVQLRPGMWTLAVTSVQGHRLPPWQDCMALSESFLEPLVAGNQSLLTRSFSVLCPFRHLEGSLAWGPFCCSACQAHKRAPLTGVLLCRLARQAPKEGTLGGVLLWFNASGG